MESEDSLEPVSWRSVFYKVRRPAIVIIMTYLVTLSVFPGVISEAQSAPLGDWYPVLQIACFNFCDTIGKILSSRHQLVSYEPSSKFTRVALVTLARFLLMPIFIICAAPLSDPLIQSEIVLFLATGLLGLTGGYIGTTAMMLGPDLVSPREKELAGTIMAFCLLSGLGLGTAVSFLFGYLIHIS